MAAITVHKHFKSQLDPVLLLLLYDLSIFGFVYVSKTLLKYIKHYFLLSSLMQYMIGALAEIASGRRLFVDNYDRKTKEIKAGIMQVTIEVAQWLGRYHETLITQI